MLPIKTRDGFLRSGVRLSDGLYQRDRKSFSLRGNEFYDISAWKLDLDWRNGARTAGGGVVGGAVAVPSRAHTTKGREVPSPPPSSPSIRPLEQQMSYKTVIVTITRVRSAQSPEKFPN